MAGRLIGNGSASSSTVASPSANRRTIERRVGSDKAAKTPSNRSGAATVIVAVARADISQIGYLTESLHIVKTDRRAGAHRQAGLDEEWSRGRSPIASVKGPEEQCACRLVESSMRRLDYDGAVGRTQ